MLVILHNLKLASTSLRKRPAQLLSLSIGPGIGITLLSLMELVPEGGLESLTEYGISACYCILAVRIHWYILVENSHKNQRVPIKSYVMYMIWACLLMMLFLVCFLPYYFIIVGQADHVTDVQIVLMGFCTLIVLYFSARLSLILPERAVGGSMKLSEIWELSRGNGWKLTASLIVPPVALNILVAVIFYTIDARMGDLAVALSTLPIIILEVALLSVAYKHFKETFERQIA